MTDARTIRPTTGGQTDQEMVSDSLLRVAAAIAQAHSAEFQAMMLDILQRDGDPDPAPVRAAILAAMRPDHPMGAGRHTIDAVRTILANHPGVASRLASLVEQGSSLAMLTSTAGRDSLATAASSYALLALQETVDALAAAILTLPEITAIGRVATGGGTGTRQAAARASLTLRMLATLLDDNGQVPMELAAATRARLAA